MSAKIETLQENEWVSLKKLVDPENHINGYVYSHEERCNGKIVSILPFRFKDSKLELLVRREVTPCWDRLRAVTSAITGGVEGKDTEAKTAVKELWEEAGYKVKPEQLIPLGFCFASKSSDTIYTLYSIDFTDTEKTGEAKGDGSKLEEIGDCYWTPEDTIKNVWDPTVSTTFIRLLSLLVACQEDKKKKDLITDSAQDKIDKPKIII